MNKKLRMELNFHGKWGKILSFLLEFYLKDFHFARIFHESHGCHANRSIYFNKFSANNKLNIEKRYSITQPIDPFRKVSLLLSTASSSVVFHRCAFKVANDLLKLHIMQIYFLPTI